MKKVVLIFGTVILLLSISTFGGITLPTKGERVVPYDVPTVAIPSSTSDTTQGASLAETLPSLVHEYGEPESLVWYEKEVYCSISYPLGGVPAADTALKLWAEQTKEAYLSADAIPGFIPRGKELTVHYESFRMNDRYASVLEEGWYNDSVLEHPKDVVYTVNIDVLGNRVLTNDEIFKPGYQPVLLSLLRSSMEAWDKTTTDAFQMDESWLSYLILNKDGIEIILPRGEFLPPALGTQRFFCSYSQLKDILALTLSEEHEKLAADVPAVSVVIPQIDAVDPQKPMVALTFDDGPSATTPHILDVLRDNKGHATFFIVGGRANNYKDTIRRVAEEGSEVASHTWSHPNLKELSRQEIVDQLENTSQLLRDLSGVAPHLLRPPYGSQNDLVRQIAEEQGLAVVNWSVDTLDWKHKNPDKTLANVQKNVKDGSIILCHDLYKMTGVAMEQVIPWLTEQGYQLVTVSTLLQYKSGEARPGALYYNG